MADNTLRFNFLVGRNDVPAAADKNSRALSGLASKTASFGKVAAVALGGAALAAGGMAAAGAVMGIKTAASLEQAQIGFTTLLGSSRKAGDYLTKLKAFAAATPFELPGLIESSRTLFGVGVNAGDAMKILQTFGDTAAAVGIDQAHFQNIMVATSQAIGAGRFMTADLNQVMNNGIPIWTILSKAMGKPIPVLRDMASKGQLLSKDVLPVLEREMHKDYGGAMAKQSQTLAGLWSTLMDTINLGLAGVIQPLMPALKSLATNGIAFLGAAFQKLPQIMSSVTTALRGLGFADALPALVSFAGRMRNDLQPVIEAVGHWFTTSLLPALRDMARDAFPAIAGAVAAVAKAFRDNRETFGNVFSTLGTVLTKVVLPAVGTLAKILGTVTGSAAGPVIGGLAKILSTVAGPALAAVAGIVAFKAAVGGVRSVIEGISSAIGSVRAKGGLLGALGGPWGVVLGVAAGALAVWATKAADARQHVDDLTDALKADSGAYGENTRATIVNRLEKEGILKQAGRLGVSLSDLTDAILGNKDAAAAVNAQLAKYHDVQQQANLTGAHAVRPLNEQERAQRALYSSAQDLRGALTSESGAIREATASARRQKEALGGATRSTSIWKNALFDTQRPLNAARDATDRWRGAISGTHRPLDTARGKTNLFRGSLLAVPNSVTTRFSTPGLNAARAGARGLATDITHINGRVVRVTYQADGSVRIGTHVARAGGGPIPGWSPSKTADNVPVAATAGEHMWSVDEVAGAGGHAGVERLRAAARAGALRLAAGGAVNRRMTTAYVGSFGPGNVMTNFIDRWAAGMAAGAGGGSGGPIPGGSRVARWGPMVHRMLSTVGLSQSLWDNWMRQIATESGGNPRAVQGNIGDINNRTGDLAKGLLQVIGATFRAYHWPGTSWNVFDPWANMTAAGNYGKQRYRSRLGAVIGHGHGYDAGGVARGRGWIPKPTRAPERVLSPRQTEAFERLVPMLSRSGGATQVNVTLQITGHAVAFEDKIVGAVRSAVGSGRLSRAVLPGVR